MTLHAFRPEILSAEASGEEDGSSERRKRRQERRRRMIENLIQGRWHGATMQDPIAVVVPAEIGEEIELPPPIEAPERLRGVEFPLCAPILAAEMASVGSAPPAFLESLLALPDRLVGAVSAALDAVRPGDGGVVDRLLSVGVENSNSSLITDYMTRLVQSEQRYFARFEETTLADEYDQDDLIDDQKRMLWEVLRRTYQARWRLKAHESTLKDDAFDLSGWRGVDLIVVPPLMAGYAMYHGFDRKFDYMGARIRFAVEPFSKWRDDDVPAGLGLEIGPEGWPVAFIVTAGLEDGQFRGDFIGIGTSIGMVRRILALEEGEGSYRER